MKNNKQALYLRLFGFCAVAFEMIIFFSKSQFDSLGEVGWMIHGGLLLSLVGVMLASFVLAQILSGKK
ncbi:MAG: hypothetical protein GW946_01620 [Candidatus Pacebacteria bacterium]|nr:hypothetical protein [Candidatus Paceibacterota bacterium]PIR60590.1 MAG: hypothetical protein COU67_01390 [Candidatus Pacebacteria bacterium CG10_big_fil_rev_8_21_14_0_10_44_54]